MKEDKRLLRELLQFGSPLSPSPVQPAGYRSLLPRTRSPMLRDPRLRDGHGDAIRQCPFQLATALFRPRVGVHGGHPQPVPGRPRARRGVPHQFVADERVDTSLLAPWRTDAAAPWGRCSPAIGRCDPLNLAPRDRHRQGTGVEVS